MNLATTVPERSKSSTVIDAPAAGNDVGNAPFNVVLLERPEREVAATRTVLVTTASVFIVIKVEVLGLSLLPRSADTGLFDCRSCEARLWFRWAPQMGTIEAAI